jgi:hypothetical protein
MKTRIELIESINKNGIIAELGVFDCEFSIEIYNRCNPKKLYLVDLFDGLVESGDVNGNNIKYINGDELFKSANEKFNKKENITILKQDSVQFLMEQDENFFDFIYIDSSHQYEHTKKELFWSLKKINKKNGIIAGHDYDEKRFYGVYRAVNEFCEENKFKINKTTDDGLSSFFIKIN